jgi:hypothetical protein
MFLLLASVLVTLTSTRVIRHNLRSHAAIHQLSAVSTWSFKKATVGLHTLQFRTAVEYDNEGEPRTLELTIEADQFTDSQCVCVLRDLHRA